MKTALLGGTFDPVHIGHLFVADEVLARLDYDRILFVPTHVPPHKATAPQASPEQRLEMLRVATSRRSEFGVLAYEIEQGAVSYTVSTLRYLYENDGLTGKPGLIIGEDLIDGFERWREVDAIEELADLVLVRRPGGRRVELNRRHEELDNLLLEISATEIRKRARTGLPFRYLVPPPVFSYIEDQALYRYDKQEA